jgi:formate hydrogenlyase subunit 3/multisubunit Na+/H+ antiporter MnhD subunit
MTTASASLVACVLAPLLGALALPAIGRRSEAARNAAALAPVLVALLGSAALLPAVLAGGTVDLVAGGVGLLRADRLAVFMALSATLLGAVIVVYAFGYMAGRPHRGEYDLLVVLFIGAMMALVYARNLLVLYAGWELTALACWRLVAYFRDEGAVRRADKAFLVTGFGAVVMLLGFVAIWADAGTFDLVALQGFPLSRLAGALVLVGLLSKSATLPLHAWLPDAGVAPSPVTALLHAAVLVKIGVYVYARLLATFAIDPLLAEVVPWIAAASALAAGAAALLEQDLKRVIAYSTISQLAFIFLGLAVGNATATGGALLFILVHAIGKGGLFLCAGLVEHATHTKDLRKLGGLARHLPWTTVAFAVCSLSVIGLPPLGGFFAKHLVLAGALEAGRTPVALVFVVGSLLTLLYLVRVFTLVFLGPEGSAVAGHEVHEGTRTMVGAVMLLAALAVASGVFVELPAALAGAAASDVVHRPAPLATALTLSLGPDAVGKAFLIALGAAALALFPLQLLRRSGPAGRAALPLLLVAAAGVLAAAGALAAGDLFTLLVYWEASLLPIAALAAAGDASGGRRTGLRAFTTGAVGDLLLLAGVGIVEALTLEGHPLADAPAGLAALGLCLAAVGATARAGAVPFHGWLPDALAEGSGPVAALLLALGKLIGLGVVVEYARAIDTAVASGGDPALLPRLLPARLALAVLGAASAAGGLALALAPGDRRRRTAHLSIAHTGLVLLAVAAGAPIAVTLGLALAGTGLLAAWLCFEPPAGAPAGDGPAWARVLRADPAALGRAVVDLLAAAAFAIERAVNAVYDVVLTGLVAALAAFSRRNHDGSHATYLVWSVVGLVAIVLFLAGGLSR